MDTLSDDILIHIFAQGTAQDISLWRRISKVWNDLISDDFVWKRAFSIYWQNNLPTCRLCPDSWKEEYVTRMTELNKMSTKTPSAIRICTKKSEIQDISISTPTTTTSNRLIKVLDLKSLTNAIIKQDGRLDQKFILYFENVFGEAPITFCKFFKLSQFSCSLILGFADGSLILFKKCPSRTLLEDYIRVPSKASSNSIVNVIPHPDDPFHNFLIIHKQSSSNCHEFVNLKHFKETCHIIVPNLKVYCDIFSNYRTETIIKIAYLTHIGDLFIATLSANNVNTAITVNTLNTTNHNLLVQQEKSIFRINLDSQAPVLFHPTSKYLFIAHSNRIFIVNHLNSVLVTSFSLSTTLETFKIQKIQEISSDLDIFECFLLLSADDSIATSTLFRVKIDVLGNSLKQEIVSNFDESANDQILSIYSNEIFFIVVTIKGIFVHDILTGKRINKCTFPRYFLKYLDWHTAEGENVRIEELDGNRFLFIWGSSLAQIWDFNPLDLSKTAQRFLQKTNRTFSEADKGLLGSKATRKYSKYAVSNGYLEWNEECDEEDHLNYLRNRLNIEGLNEEELISYAKLISQSQDHQDNQDLESALDDSCELDPDLKLALQLSLLEM